MPSHPGLWQNKDNQERSRRREQGAALDCKGRQGIAFSGWMGREVSLEEDISARVPADTKHICSPHIGSHQVACCSTSHLAVGLGALTNYYNSLYRIASQLGHPEVLALESGSQSGLKR